MKKVALSVVIPSFNHERYIGAALDSVRAQTLAPGEIIVVDDGSSDDSVEVIRAHDAPGLRLIEQENRGAHAAINRAIEESTGDYVAILNSDDLYEPGHLEQVLAVAQSRRAGLVFGSVALIDPEGAPLSDDHEVSTWYANARAAAVEELVIQDVVRPHNVAMTTSNFVLHRALWRELGGFRAFRYVHDYDFLLRSIDLCPDDIRFERDLFGVRYRIHPSNTIAENVELALAEREEMLRRHDGTGRRLRAGFWKWTMRGQLRSALTTPVAGLPGPARTPDVVTDPLRIGIVARTLDVGGLEEVVSTLALALTASGCDVSVVCTDRGGLVAERLRRAGVPVHVGGGRRLETWARESNLDVISSHFSSHKTIRALSDTGVPIFETVHNTYGWFDSRDWEEERAKVRLLTGLIAVSDTASRYYERKLGMDAVLDVIPNAVDPIRAATLPVPVARPWRHKGALFVFLGRLTHQKNLMGLVDAFSSLAVDRDARLWLVGPDDEGVGQALRRRHARLFADGRARLQSEVRGLGGVFSAADAYVANSFYEGWSVAASEALWTGAAVILSECGGALELVGDESERGILVPNPLGDPLDVSPAWLTHPPKASVHSNEEALSGAFADFVEKLDDWRAGREARKAWARRELAPERMAARYLEVLSAAARTTSR